MLTEKVILILKDYMALEEEQNNIYHSSNYWHADEAVRAPLRRRTEEINARMSEYAEIIKKIKLEVKKPNKIIGARATTSFGQRLDEFDCNDLLHIKLSEYQQTGLVRMPYEFDANGNAYRVNESHEYYIGREGKQVYLINPLHGNSLTRWYKYIRL